MNTVLLCERINKANQYTELLTNAYQEYGLNVILDVQNFLFSDFLPEFVHIQWPEAIYRWRHQLPHDERGIRLIRERLNRYHDAGIPIVYTVHNLLPHGEITNFDREVYKQVLRTANVIVHHGTTSISLLKSNFPECKQTRHIVCPHGPYPATVKDPSASRHYYHLPMEKYAYLNFGRQRQNKGGSFIRSVFRSWHSQDTCLFTIGPKVHSEPRRINSRIFSLLDSKVKNFKSLFSTREKNFYQKIRNNEIPRIMAASDVVFLGHQEGLNSGILALAASYGKPVVFPDLGNFREQMQGWPWYESYQAGNIKSAVDALDRMKERLAHVKPGTICFNNQEWLTINSWGIHARNIVETVGEIKSTLPHIGAGKSKESMVK